VIGNHVRATVRRRRLATRLALFTEVTADSTVEAAARIEALHRLAALSEAEREALLLVAWDGMTSDDAAQALGISPAAFRKRLSRGRQSVLAAESSQQDPAAMTIGAEDGR
jgi:RNA polymerase sigma-70 factor (ECF subfamily)